MQIQPNVVLVWLVSWCPAPRPMGCGGSLTSQFLVNISEGKQVLIWKCDQSLPVGDFLERELSTRKFRGHKVTLVRTSRVSYSQLWSMPIGSPEGRGHSFMSGHFFALQATSQHVCINTLWINKLTGQRTIYQYIDTDLNTHSQISDTHIMIVIATIITPHSLATPTDGLDVKSTFSLFKNHYNRTTQINTCRINSHWLYVLHWPTTVPSTLWLDYRMAARGWSR